MNGWRVPALVALMFVLASALIYDQLFAGEDTVDISPGPGPSASTVDIPGSGGGSATINPLGGWPLAAFSEVLTRPVFSQSRRESAPPPPPPVVEEAPPEPPPEPVSEVDFTLYGVVASQAGRYALLRDNGSGSFVRLGQAHEIQGWTLESVGAREIVMTKAGERRTLRLSDKKPDVQSDEKAAQPAPDQ
ncbi:hypothetical protein BH10PSE7_BH10PSE7_05960 [soil metagenome]